MDKMPNSKRREASVFFNIIFQQTLCLTNNYQRYEKCLVTPAQERLVWNTGGD